MNTPHTPSPGRDSGARRPRCRPSQRRRFTLMEMLVALLLLGLVLGSAMAFAAQASGNVVQARADWNATHAVTQATEAFLACQPRHLDLPSELLPDGYSASCQVEAAVDGLPDFAAQARDGWILARYRVVVLGPDGETVGVREVYKIVAEDAL